MPTRRWEPSTDAHLDRPDPRPLNASTVFSPSHYTRPQTAVPAPVKVEGASPSLTTEQLIAQMNQPHAGLGQLHVKKVPTIDAAGDVYNTRPARVLLITHPDHGRVYGTWWELDPTASFDGGFQSARDAFRHAGELRVPDIAVSKDEIKAVVTRTVATARASHDTASLAALERTSADLDAVRPASQIGDNASETWFDASQIDGSELISIGWQLAERLPAKTTALVRLDKATDRAVLERQVGEVMTMLDARKGARVIHSDDGRRFVIAFENNGKRLAIVTDDMKLIRGSALLKETILMGSAGERGGPSQFGAVRYVPGSPRRPAEALALADDRRLVEPKTIVSGLPLDDAALNRQQLRAASLREYRALDDAVHAAATARGARLIRAKADVLELLRAGTDDAGIIVAHSDGTNLYIGNEILTLDELQRLPARRTAATRTIILAVCNAGKATAEAESFASLFIKKGFAGRVLAPQNTIFGDDARALLEAFDKPLSEIRTLLDKMNGHWRVFVLVGPSPTETSPT